MLRAGMTVFVVVTDHPQYPKVIHEGGWHYAAFRERTTAEQICAAWNSYYTDSHTPQPWPFYVLETIVQPPVAVIRAAEDAELQRGFW